MSSMNKRVFKTNIKEFKDLEKDNLPFGRQIPLFKTLRDWNDSPETKRGWASKKRKSLTRALKEFKDLYGVKEFHASFGENDDTFEVFYR